MLIKRIANIGKVLENWIRKQNSPDNRRIIAKLFIK
jgi:hypothetical protein